MWEIQRTRSSVHHRGLIDGPHGRVDADAEGRRGAEPRDVEGNIPIDSARDAVVVDQQPPDSVRNAHDALADEKDSPKLAAMRMSPLFWRSKMKFPLRA